MMLLGMGQQSKHFLTPCCLMQASEATSLVDFIIDKHLLGDVFCFRHIHGDSYYKWLNYIGLTC